MTIRHASGPDLGADIRDLALHFGMRALPTGACSQLGGWLGIRLGQNSHPVANARARALLARLRSDWAAAPETLDAKLTTLWKNVGRTYAEFACVQRILAEGRHVVYGEATLSAAYAAERPLILCFLHLGNWEVLGHYVTTHKLIRRGRPFSGIVMPPTSRARAFIVDRQRAALPIDLMPMGRQVWHKIADTLRRPGGIAWLAADEAAGGRVFAPLFGRCPRTDGNLGKIIRLAALTGAGLILMYNERVGASRLRSHILPMLDIPTGRLDTEAIQDQVLRINSVIEPIVRSLLTQWYMAIEFGADLDNVE